MLCRGQILVIHMIHHHHGRTRAGGETLLFALQINAPVRRAFAGLDAELLLDMIDHLLRAAQHAGNIGAHRDVMAANGFGLEHRIKGGDLIHLDVRQPKYSATASMRSG